MQNGFKRRFEPIKILSNSNIEQIHTASLEILEELGFKYESEKALKLLEAHGCKVDYTTMVAKIPSGLVEWALDKTPSSFLVRAREPEKSLRIGGNTMYFMNSTGARHVNIDTGILTTPTLKQNNIAVLVSDSLDTVHVFPSYTPYFEIENVPPVMSCPVSCAQRHRFSTKPSRGATEAESFIWEIKIAEVLDCQLLGLICGNPPFSMGKDNASAAFAYLDAGFPIYVASGSPLGSTRPVTVSGGIASYNAELFAIIVLIQCIKPGSGVLVDDSILSLNMQTGDMNFGTAATAMQQMAFNQMWHSFYKVPVSDVGAAFSNSKIIDYQLGAEKLPVAMCSALSGGNIIVLHGGVTAELAYNPVLAIIDDDIARTIGRIIEGFDVNDDAIGLNYINEVGFTGSFLSKKHTRAYWKTEDYMPKIFDKTSYSEWIDTGKKTVVDKAKEKYEDILANYKPKPVTDEQDKEIDKILKEAENYYRKKGLL
ncbi:MAG: hypothetical protein FJW68_01690 [Actinobacteria bacterium]|nr:hypothetical protein [Actinomycetota bacterium]